MIRKVVIGVIVVISIVVLVMAGQAKPRAAPDGGEIAVLNVEGLINGGYNGADFLGGFAGSRSIMAQLRQIKDDPNIRAVVLRVNSPGGSAAAGEEIGREIDRVRAAGKLVVTSMGDVAASGGYWIAAKSDYIFANNATMTGSIGVIMEMTELQELYEKLGIDINVIKSGPHKDIGASSRPLTESERDILQAMVDDIYGQFVKVVAEGRSMSEERVKELADGRIYTGSQALELGLVDDIGNFYDAIDFAADKVGIKGRPTIRTYGRQSPLELFLSSGQKYLHGLNSLEWRLLDLEFLSDYVRGENLDVR